MGPRAGLDGYGKSRPHRVRFPDLPARSESLYRLSYPAHTGDFLQNVRKEPSSGNAYIKNKKITNCYWRLHSLPLVLQSQKNEAI